MSPRITLVALLVSVVLLTPFFQTAVPFDGMMLKYVEDTPSGKETCVVIYHDHNATHFSVEVRFRETRTYYEKKGERWLIAEGMKVPDAYWIPLPPPEEILAEGWAGNMSLSLSRETSVTVMGKSVIAYEYRGEHEVNVGGFNMTLTMIHYYSKVSGVLLKGKYTSSVLNISATATLELVETNVAIVGVFGSDWAPFKDQFGIKAVEWIIIGSIATVVALVIALWLRKRWISRKLPS